MVSDVRKELIAYLGKDWDDLTALIVASLSSDIELLNRANENIFSHKGKMMRPAASLLMARACMGGERTETSLKYAAAVEILHNATLLHDDVADDSSERRGIPTTASILGKNASVLLGDFWLVRALELVLDADEYNTRVIRLFSKTLSDLAEGEMLQLQKAAVCDTSSEDYFRIIYSKTASLFETSCVSAAISVAADSGREAAAREYGRCLGIAFQIKDDILDYTDSDQLGKPSGVDVKERKITLPLLGALSKSDDETNRKIRRMVCDMDRKPFDAQTVMDFVIDNGGLEYASEVLDEYVSKAKDALASLPESKARTYLEKLADFTAIRKV